MLYLCVHLVNVVVIWYIWYTYMSEASTMVARWYIYIPKNDLALFLRALKLNMLYLFGHLVYTCRDHLVYLLH
jgi:hypothetical protein